MTVTEPSRRKRILSVSAVSRVFGSDKNAFYALSDINIDVYDGEFLTLLGPSGCGKTTLLRLIAGFDHPTSGHILLDNAQIEHLPPHKRHVNTVFQSYALFPHMTVAQNIAFGLEMRHVAPAERAKIVAEMLALIRLEAFADRRPDQISGGQQQRVALARALANKPRILLLDESLSALDFKLRKQMQHELKQLQIETGITFVFVTHDQEEALSMSDRIVVMKDGHIQQLGTPEEIYDQPANRFVADFIGEANLLPGPLLGRPAGTTIALRPERLILDDQRPGRLTATVESVTYLGGDHHYHLRITPDMVLSARPRSTDRRFASGETVAVSWADGAEIVLTD